jgi:molybdopterin-guanine dinucleotide biosynthesis protein A
MQKTIGLILAGGQSRRMGGVDKGLVLLHDKPLLEYIIDRFSPQVGQLYISANRNMEKYQAYGYPVINDSRTGFTGPLAGILSALQYLEHAEADLATDLLITPVDTPRLPMDLCRRMYQAKKGTPDANQHIYAAHDGIRLQPLFLMLPLPGLDTLIRYRESLENYLDAGHHKVVQWLEDQNCIQADFSDELESFVNINSTDDLNALTPDHDP